MFDSVKIISCIEPVCLKYVNADTTVIHLCECEYKIKRTIINCIIMLVDAKIASKMIVTL